jgi:peroxiredoxin
MQKKIKILFLIFVLGLAGFTFCRFYPNFPLLSPEEKTQAKEQAIDKIKVKDQPGLLRTSTQYAKIDALAPDFITEDVYGNKISLSDFRNKKPVLLAFWATWCGYCTKELPELKAFINEHQDQIQVMAVTSGESRTAIINYVQRKNVNFLMLLDEDRRIWNQYLVKGTPTHFLVGRDGRIVTKRIGLAFKKDLEAMLTLIRE